MNRFKALDVFRGMTIFLMIVVNSPGDWGKTFGWLLHANWHGFTVTDLVFPSFLFAVGTSLAFVKRKWADQSAAKVFTKIAKRALIIFLLGYVMYWFPFVHWTEAGELAGNPLSETRIWGVLQRIAVCYFVAAIMVYACSKSQLVITSVVMLIGYWVILFFFGDYSLENNAARLLDVWLFGNAHLYHGEGIPFDPEGLLSTLPAVVNVIGGYLAGAYLVESKSANYEKIAKLLLVGCGLMTIAFAWDHVFPVNKKLWTSSFVLLTVGIDFVVIAALVYAIDIRSKPIPFSFFEVFGKNPLVIYLLSQYLITILYFIRIGEGQSLLGFIYEKGFCWLPEYRSSLAFALAFTMLCWGVGWWMDRKRIYVKV